MCMCGGDGGGGGGDYVSVYSICIFVCSLYAAINLVLVIRFQNFFDILKAHKNCIR